MLTSSRTLRERTMALIQHYSILITLNILSSDRGVRTACEIVSKTILG